MFVSRSPLPAGISPARLAICGMGMLEWLYSAMSARDYNTQNAELREAFHVVQAPADIFARVLRLQSDLANHGSMWHRRAIGDLFIAETALSHRAVVLHLDSDFELIQKVRPSLLLHSL
ncbi:MAG: VapC toxin family PIN domain ribonuclease [Micropruina sp.]|uniref:PIN domain-containing protein n=1 Tax=Micropruina sp. TaxID=2737536 RepID=UPI0039E6CF2F